MMKLFFAALLLSSTVHALDSQQQLASTLSSQSWNIPGEGVVFEFLTALDGSMTLRSCSDFSAQVDENGNGYTACSGGRSTSMTYEASSRTYVGYLPTYIGSFRVEAGVVDNAPVIIWGGKVYRPTPASNLSEPASW